MVGNPQKINRFIKVQQPPYINVYMYSGLSFIGSRHVTEIGHVAYGIPQCLPTFTTVAVLCQIDMYPLVCTIYVCSLEKQAFVFSKQK